MQKNELLRGSRKKSYPWLERSLVLLRGWGSQKQKFSKENIVYKGVGGEGDSSQKNLLWEGFWIFSRTMHFSYLFENFVNQAVSRFLSLMA